MPRAEMNLSIVLLMLSATASAWSRRWRRSGANSQPSAARPPCSRPYSRMPSRARWRRSMSRPPSRPGHVVVGVGAHALLERMLVDRHVVVAHVVQPVDDVAAAVAPGRARRAAQAEVHARGPPGAGPRRSGSPTGPSPRPARRRGGSAAGFRYSRRVQLRDARRAAARPGAEWPARDSRRSPRRPGRRGSRRPTSAPGTRRSGRRAGRSTVTPSSSGGSNDCA